MRAGGLDLRAGSGPSRTHGTCTRCSRGMIRRRSPRGSGTSSARRWRDLARIGLLSDIHGNLAALELVLAALDAAEVDRVVCLGDIVGYNPEANECVATVKERGVAAIAGNHDLIALGRLGFDRCA